MRPGQHNKRSRNRHRSTSGGSGSSSSSSGGNPLSRVYESNGPDVKVRGTAQTVADKYLQLGRDTQSAGDSVMAESYYQYAEHYLRIVAAAQAYQQQMQPQSYHRPGEDEDDDGDDSPETASVESRHPVQPAEQPDLGGQPSFDGDRPPQQQYQQNNRPREYRDQRNQPYSNRDRDQAGQPSGNDRNRPRFQDRGDQQQGTARDTRPYSPQPRPEEQVRDLPQPANSSPVVNAGENDPQWEAPSFLRRPAPLPPVEADQPATPEVEAAAPPRRTRKPRRDTAALPVPAPEPASD